MSLVAQILNDIKRKKQPVICVQIDFLLAGTPESAQRYLLDAVAKGIADALMALDRIAGKEKHSVVIFMDKFQQLGELVNNAVLEAAIRHAAQYARHTAYVFTGSNRHLLGMMFDDSARPLYHMCDHILLTRIAAEEYRKFIQRAAKTQWRKQLDTPILEIILKQTDCHPYYLNVLCGQLWKRAIPASTRVVTTTWYKYVASERHRVSKEINALNNYQRELLTRIALHPTAHPRSHEYLEATTIKSGSVTQLMEKLMSLDLIYVDQRGIYRLVDPVIDTTIQSIAGA